MSDSNNRLDRIERKLDSLAETVIALARVEEKLVSLEKHSVVCNARNDTADERIDSLEKETSEIKVAVKTTNDTMSNVSRVFWSLLIAALIGLGAMVFKVIALSESTGLQPSHQKIP